jgi:hypothetical protein
MAYPVKTTEFEDGDRLGGGLVVSLKGGFCVAVYRCGCGREQTAECETFDGGISPQAAQGAGWEMLYNDYGWICPLCSSQTSKLKTIFKQS